MQAARKFAHYFCIGSSISCGLRRWDNGIVVVTFSSPSFLLKEEIKFFFFIPVLSGFLAHTLVEKGKQRCLVNFTWQYHVLVSISKPTDSANRFWIDRLYL